MSTTKHTPGPWRIESGPYYRAIRVDFEVIADMRQIGRSFNESNARLIAAAPDLLDALENVIESWGLGLLPHEDSEALDQARAAITKAKGES